MGFNFEIGLKLHLNFLVMFQILTFIDFSEVGLGTSPNILQPNLSSRLAYGVALLTNLR